MYKQNKLKKSLAVKYLKVKLIDKLFCIKSITVTEKILSYTKTNIFYVKRIFLKEKRVSKLHFTQIYIKLVKMLKSNSPQN